MFKGLPGFRDFYPENCAVRNHIFKIWRKTARIFNFAEFDAPVLEPLELFTAKSGDEIVTQLFNFEDKGGRKVTLRAEMTPSLARMVGAKANGMRKPIKWFTIGENFRYERPQKGRLRSFYQFNADILGEASPKADAEIIALLVKSLTAFGFNEKEFTIRLSDRNLWIYLLQSWGLEGEDALNGALGVVDKMERESPEKTLEHMRKFLGDKAEGFLEKVKALTKVSDIGALRAFFKDNHAHPKIDERLGEWDVLLEQLVALGVSEYISLDLGVVRGLAYYTGFVFEAFQTIGTARALAGGGRYDHLVKKLGGPELPAVGFAIGDVTLRDFLELKSAVPQYVDGPDFFVITGGVAESKAALGDVTKLRDAGYQVEYSFKDSNMGKQFKEANQLGARYALVYGSEELVGGEVTFKNLKEGTEERVPREALLDYLRGV